MSALRNGFSFVDCTSESKIWKIANVPVPISIPYNFYASLLAKKGSIFSLLSVGYSLTSPDCLVARRC